GIIDAPEVCDDGNTVDNDGCTSCAIDTGYHCNGVPSMCAVSPPADTCGTAIPVTMNGTIMGSFDMFNDDYDPPSGGCTTYAEHGADIAYAVTMGAGQVLNATLNPASWQDLAFYVLTDCASAATSCVAGSDLSGVESVTYTSPAAQTVYVIVDGY